ncbi:hypothetical protein FJ527_04770 [Mesorhizobium sp. B2-4-18]|uniref:hypothetical protein n=1 Tax=Mesorhizobium sp. B2-4-18 TaxID=2589931 RepID=UPI00112D0229|nr:hypothetical protein [Mesorhizobium sp. B2-4-18]TPK79435.1 hypothetical protein FJ527_04770 [Mesorhizobium sp. B2-4-18]
MDLSAITSVIGLATTALGATEKAATTAEVVKKLFASDKKPENSEVQALLNTLGTQLTAANMMNVDLSDAIKALSRELKREDDFEKERGRYELFETPEHDVVFKLKEDAANGQPMHFACPVCMNRDKLFSYVTGDGDFKLCQTDKAHLFRFRNSPIRSRVAFGRDRSGI